MPLSVECKYYYNGFLEGTQSQDWRWNQRYSQVDDQHSRVGCLEIRRWQGLGETRIQSGI